MAVAPPSTMKTELIRALDGLPRVHSIDTLTPKTFISGQIREEKDDGLPSSSLLHRIGPSGIVMCADFSTILAIKADERKAILADLRRIYDGELSKQFGTSDVVAPWKGHITFVAAVTPAIDQHYGSIQTRQLCVQRSEWRGHVTLPKSGRLRRVPLTSRLAAALRQHRHLRGPRVLCEDDGTPLTPKVVSDHVRRSARRAGLSNRGVHVLRHSFCSHLAMRGAPARAIQELAGHQELGTTQRYMHLSPAALDAAIRLLDLHGQRGDSLETAAGESAKGLT
jgi:hypothetical protein